MASFTIFATNGIFVSFSFGWEVTLRLIESNILFGLSMRFANEHEISIIDKIIFLSPAYRQDPSRNLAFHYEDT